MQLPALQVPLAAYCVSVLVAVHFALGGVVHGGSVAQGSLVHALPWQVHAIRCSVYWHLPALQLPSWS